MCFLKLLFVAYALIKGKRRIRALRLRLTKKEKKTFKLCKSYICCKHNIGTDVLRSAHSAHARKSCSHVGNFCRTASTNGACQADVFPCDTFAIKLSKNKEVTRDGIGQLHIEFTYDKYFFMVNCALQMSHVKFVSLIL